MSQGLSMFGADRRLIIANEQYAEVYGIPPDVIKPGMTLREIRELRVAAGSYYGDPELYVESADAVTGVRARLSPSLSTTTAASFARYAGQVRRRWVGYDARGCNRAQTC